MAEPVFSFRPLGACRHAAMVGTISMMAERFLNTVSEVEALLGNRPSGRLQNTCGKVSPAAPSYCTCTFAMLAKPRF
jgi:hypothetical protein